MFNGLYAVLVTPFTAEGAVDQTSLDRLIDFYLEKQVQGLVTLSVMGEGSLLSASEKIQVATRVIHRVSDRVPVVVGINEPDAIAAAQMSQRFVALGASALLVARPTTGLPNLDSLIQHYQTVASATPVPLVLLDYPPITGKLPISFLKRLVDEIDTVQAIKLEDIPTDLKIGQLRAAVGDRLGILGACGGIHCLSELAAGSDGLMTGYAYPEQLVSILHQFRSGDRSGATQAYNRWLPLLKYEQQFGLALRKEILRQRGAIACATLRISGVAIDNRVLAELERLLIQIDEIQILHQPLTRQIPYLGKLT
jgi:4-hydroxy-tetrahydrodipicolinate synthase